MGEFINKDSFNVPLLRFTKKCEEAPRRWDKAWWARPYREAEIDRRALGWNMIGPCANAARLITAWQIDPFPDKVWVGLVQKDVREDDVRPYVHNVGGKAELANDFMGNRVVGSIDEIPMYLDDHDDEVFSGCVIA